MQAGPSFQAGVGRDPAAGLPYGITATELAARHGLPVDELVRWLRREGLAERSNTGLLVPTARALSLAEALTD